MAGERHRVHECSAVVHRNVIEEANLAGPQVDLNDRHMTHVSHDRIEDAEVGAVGAYFQYGVGHHGNALSQIVGPYRIRSVDLQVTAVLTNKCQQGAYRGFGSEVANFVIERMVDAAVDELGLDSVEFRRMNFIRPEDFPYKIPTGNLYDSGNYAAVLDEALRLLDYEGWRKKQAE